MTFYSWTQGDFSYYDLLIFLPFVSGQAARAIGNGLEAGIDDYAGEINSMMLETLLSMLMMVFVSLLAQ
ncbi:MAG: hypothetical protein KAX49_18175 [Halanaerobiales bacterium]|nr:hypothetical protein [Halanaerobiales bacterium]